MPNINNSSNTEEIQQKFMLDDALEVMVKLGSSDLHLSVTSPPKVRINGDLKNLGKIKFTKETLHEAMYGILNNSQKKEFEEEEELDFAYEINNVGRFRVNYFVQRGNPSAVFRYISTKIKSLEQLHMPPQIAKFSEMPRGLVLVTGPTGSGKSTTLAAVVDLINRNRACHIMTIEDPIEYIHQNKKALINQRQVGTDTHSFAAALKHVLREDPDVILLGEMRDLETISVALTAAETGHLVLATLHTQSAVQSIDRILDVFPPDQQAQIRTQLATTLKGVLCQALMPCIDVSKGRVAATEIMFVNSAISNMIRSKKTHQITSTLEGGRNVGMHTMDQSLAKLVNNRDISYETALTAVANKKTFDMLIDSTLRTDNGESDHKEWGEMSNVPFDNYVPPKH